VIPRAAGTVRVDAPAIGSIFNPSGACCLGAVLLWLTLRTLSPDGGGRSARLTGGFKLENDKIDLS